MIWGSISKTRNIFQNAWVLPLFICKVTTIKVNFNFYKQCSQSETCLICEQAIFLQNVYIEKNPLKKISTVLEMKLKTYNLVGSKFVFKKIKFKILHYIQHDFIRQCPEFSKEQASILKSCVINYFILKYCHTF